MTSETYCRKKRAIGVQEIHLQFPKTMSSQIKSKFVHTAHVKFTKVMNKFHTLYKKRKTVNRKLRTIKHNCNKGSFYLVRLETMKTDVVLFKNGPQRKDTGLK